MTESRTTAPVACALTRRQLMGLLAIPAMRSFAQEATRGSKEGMASRGVKAAPRGKSSGIPFRSTLVDVSARSGLHGVTLCGHPRRADYVIEEMGCGAAFIDFDNDGWVDLLVLSSSRFGDPPADSTNRLYKNNRDGSFIDVTEKAGLFRSGYFYGVTVGDYNNDGWEDLFFTGYPHNMLYRNNGDGTFTDVTKEAGLLDTEARFGSGCTFIDYDRDGKLDLFVSNYVGFDIKTVPRAGEQASCNAEHVFCGPRGLAYGRHSLYRNNGDGTFSDVTAAAGIAKANQGYGLTAVAADFDDDGWPDIYVACDSTPSLLFLNQRDGSFKEQALERGVALSDDGMEQAGMGVGVGDLKLTGALDIVKTHFAADTPAVYVNDGKGNFSDDTLGSGLATETRFISWGVGIHDFDNDGNPDIFWVTGGIYPELQDRADQPFRGPRILFRNLGGGRFEELITQGGAALKETHCSRGCAFGDFDNDGDVDVLIVNVNEPPTLLRNDVDRSRHWIKFKLEGVKSNRSAIGARVTVHYGGKTQTQALMSQVSYLSVNDNRLHFGLGAAAVVDAEVRWPSGATETLKQVAANQLVHVKEGAGIVKAERWG